MEAKKLPGVPFEPKGERIVIVRSGFKQTGRIYLPDTAKPKPTCGTVVAIGPDVMEDFVELNETIVFSLYAGVATNIKDENGEVISYIILRPDEILGKLLVDTSRMGDEATGV